MDIGLSDKSNRHLFLQLHISPPFQRRLQFRYPVFLQLLVDKAITGVPFIIDKNRPGLRGFGIRREGDANFARFEMTAHVTLVHFEQGLRIDR